MAVKYWINGGVDNNWGTSGNWSLASGGGGGAGVPSSSDDVTFDGNGNVNCTIATSLRSSKTLTITSGYTSTITFTTGLSVLGNITINSGFAGTLSPNGGTLSMVTASGTWTSNGYIYSIPLGNNASTTITLADDLKTTSNYTSNNNVVLTNNTLTVGGSISIATGTASGTANIIMNGSGSLSTAAGAILKNNVTINSAGSVTIGNMNYNTGTLTNTSGLITSTGVISINTSNTTLDLAGASIGGITVSVGGITITFKSGVILTGSLTATGPIQSAHAFFVSSVGGVQRSVTLAQGATQSINFLDATDINSSAGQTIWTWRGILSNTNNWNVMSTSPRTASYTYC